MRRAVGRWWLGVEIWERIRSAGLSDVGYGRCFFWGRQTGDPPAVRLIEDLLYLKSVDSSKSE